MRTPETRGLHVGACTALLIAAAMPLAAQDHHHHAEPAAAELGRVSFPTSCDAAAQPAFERGVAALHSFFFEAAIEAFSAAAAADAGCAMPHWGEALAHMGNPFVGRDPAPDRLRQGRDAAARAAALAPPSGRERGYVDAAAALYRDFEARPHRARMVEYESAMQALRERHPDDPEAAIFYALAVLANTPADDLSFERQRHVATTILEPLFSEQPEHPGLAHYLIHAYDFPPLAEHGLAAARRYAEIAPAAPHALHMPSHIFTRLGYWEESAETNRRSADAERDPAWRAHPLDYEVYAFLQLGRDESARRSLEEARRAQPEVPPGLTAYNYVAMPARYALERDRWAEAAELEVPAATGLGFVEAVTRFARAIGAARSDDPDRADAELARLAALRDQLQQQDDDYWARVVEAQRLAAAAWAEHARGADDEALRLARAAAELEESVEKHPVTPGPLLPARELEGELLLRLGRAQEALDAYERVLGYEPRRARAVAGAAHAAELAGRTDVARARYAELAELMAGAEAPRPELARAAAFLARP